MKKKIEEMASFFDARADGYDQHMRDNIQGFVKYYQALAKPIEGRGDAFRILDLGCGTGLEFPYLFEAAPQALITGMDISEEMMREGSKTHRAFGDQIQWTRGSYVTDPLGKLEYKVILSSMTMHHFFVHEKRKIYQKIFDAVKMGGIYIEGDYMVSSDEEVAALARYFEQTENSEGAEIGKFHLDIPFSVKRQVMLLKSVGFDPVRVIYRTTTNAVLVASKLKK
ncbi:class I SAM-dependent methyltransferase [Gottschalkiaceae bacterium SANA]|nr:class I SAM-dependent methyltransferase [Gottschalkiaceae bacterium SANA]